MTRRAGVALASAWLWIAVAAPTASAHGLGGRVDLPVPRWLFVVGAATALVVSFVLLGALWRTPRFPVASREGRDGVLQALLRSPAAGWAVRIASLALFVVVAISSLLPAEPDRVLGPVVVFIWFWVGLAFAQALLGDWWATLSPFDTLGRLLGLEEGSRPYPLAWGAWPAALGLLAFVWIELTDPFGGAPGSLGLAIVAYTAVQIIGMARYGRAAWIRGGEAFAVYLGLFAAMAPLHRDGRGRVVLGAPVARLAEVPVRPGLLALVLVALGSTTFDGFTRTTLWLEWTGALVGVGRTVAATAGLLAAIGLVGILFALAMRAASASVAGGGPGWHPLAVRFAHSLVPIAFAYVVAHYFSYLVIEGQLVLAALSDPFDLGWDLFGTAGTGINLDVLAPTTVWNVQVAAIVLGHIAGVVLAHDLALRLFPEGGAVRTQLALLAVMVAFTAGGLLILSG